MTSALYSVAGSTAQTAHVVAYGSTTALAFASTSGIDSGEWTVVGQSHAATSVTITPGTKGLTASLVFPSDPGLDWSVLIEGKANGGRGPTGAQDPALRCYRVIGTTTHGALVPVCVNEEFARDASVGWASALNELIASRSARRAIADADCTVGLTDYRIAYTSITAARVVNLPPAATCKNRSFVIKDESGSVDVVKTITIEPYGSETIQDASNTAITSAYGSIKPYSNGTEWHLD